ncbi:oxidoreductase [Victivallis sp. Marseille-Q1083]|uniref:oxidoreductase n=1 Tax=Victivallis sp. Marseille-Q1083 TaxID=2717288 RepID=UPI001588C77C|nr:oxidoreductase [Victivallis sp. Marseille-Q1083]
MAKKKVGIIDYHIDEWHANHLPEFFAGAQRRNEFELYCAWEESPAAPPGQPLQTYCAAHGLIAAGSIQAVVEQADCLLVLAPSNPETHCRLAELPLKSGKPTYIDKTFAPDLEAAMAMIRLAGQHRTPFFTSSALRFSSELLAARRQGIRPSTALAEGGGSSFEEYCIHQIEMVVSALGTGAIRLMQCGTPDCEHLVLQYADSRFGTLTLRPDLDFRLLLGEAERTVRLDPLTAFFPNFTDALLEFFTTGVSPVPVEETIEVIKIRDAALAGLSKRHEWIAIR